MNQYPKVQQKPKVRRWLWITLLIEIAIAVGLSVWIYLIPATEITTISPSPKITNNLISPSSSAIPSISPSVSPSTSPGISPSPSISPISTSEE